jgi:hypothetical protein
VRTAAFVVLMLLPGCSGLKLDGGCHYERTVVTRYQCEPGSKVEHYRLAPTAPD